MIHSKFQRCAPVSRLLSRQEKYAAKKNNLKSSPPFILSLDIRVKSDQ